MCRCLKKCIDLQKLYRFFYSFLTQFHTDSNFSRNFASFQNTTICPCGCLDSVMSMILVQSASVCKLNLKMLKFTLIGFFLEFGKKVSGTNSVGSNFG